jgi:hypothetical protein
MAVPTLKEWETFYVIVGSSAGALTGLMFVVVALAGDRVRSPGTGTGLAAYTTPSIFHFSIVMFVSALVVMPRHSLTSLGPVLDAAAIMGGMITVRALLRIRRIEEYQAVAEDWIWHGILPILAYVTMVVAAVLLVGSPEISFYLIASVSLALLYIGIHNAWDAALYSVIYRPKNQA